MAGVLAVSFQGAEKVDAVACRAGVEQMERSYTEMTMKNRKVQEDG